MAFDKSKPFGRAIGGAFDGLFVQDDKHYAADGTPMVLGIDGHATAAQEPPKVKPASGGTKVVKKSEVEAQTEE